MQTVASEKLRTWLGKKGNTQEGLAARLREHTGDRTNQSTISAWAAGRQTPRGLAVVAALQSILRISVRDWSTPFVPTVDVPAVPKTGTEG